MRRPVLGLIFVCASWAFLDQLYLPRHPITALGLGLFGFLLSVEWPRRPKVSAAIGREMGTWSVILLFQAFLLPFLPLLASHSGSLPKLSPLLAAAIRFFGGNAASVEGLVHVEKAGVVGTFGIEVDQFAPFFLLRFLLGMVLLGWMGRFPGISRAVWRRLLMGTLIFIPLRVLFLNLISVQTGNPYLFVEPAWTLVTHLPLGLFMARILCHPGGKPERPGPSSIPIPLAGNRRRRTPILAMVLAGILFAAGLGFFDPGIQGGGRVLVDESHGDWEGTSVPFNAEKYGQASLYNYRCWRDWLSLHYDLEVKSIFPSEQELEGIDVLIIKTPTDPYSSGEIETIRNYVGKGGGLLLIGDHTNLFGMSTVLNGLARPYGIRFNFDDTYPLAHGARQVYRPPWILPHPLVHSLRRYSFETSCSLQVPLRAEHAMVGLSLGRDLANYSHKNFFGNLRLDPGEDFGAFVQMAVIRHRQGRVIAFTDSTNFSNFSFFWPGRRELSLSMVEYLNRRNTAWGMVRAPCILLAIICIFLSFRAMGGRPTVWRLAGGILGLWIGLGAGSLGLVSWNANTFRPPPPHQDPGFILFDQTWSGAAYDVGSPLLIRNRTPERNLNFFNSFFVNSARFGLLPTFGETTEKSLEEVGYLVILNPDRHFSRRDRGLLDRFVRRGGNLLLMDSILNPGSTSNELLGAYRLGFRLAFHPPPPEEPPGSPPAKGAVPRTIKLVLQAMGPGPVIGFHQSVQYASVQHGEGRIVAVADSTIFSDGGMGILYKLPEGGEWEGHRIQAKILAHLKGTASIAPPSGGGNSGE